MRIRIRRESMKKSIKIFSVALIAAAVLMLTVTPGYSGRGYYGWHHGYWGPGWYPYWWGAAALPYYWGAWGYPYYSGYYPYYSGYYYPYYRGYYYPYYGYYPYGPSDSRGPYYYY
jgi:hypothetical protein